MSQKVKAGWALVLCVLLAAMGAVAAAPQAGEAKGPASPVDLNQASVEQLQELPGIGPALAGRIVEFRDKQGGFERVEDLLKIKGIGEKSFQKLRPHVTVGKKR